MDCSPPGSSVRGILQARILEWVTIPYSRGSSWPRDWIWVSCIPGRFLSIWATREAPLTRRHLQFIQQAVGYTDGAGWASCLCKRAFIYSENAMGSWRAISISTCREELDKIGGMKTLQGLKMLRFVFQVITESTAPGKVARQSGKTSGPELCKLDELRAS